MKKFKKELSWLLVAALVVSSLALGFGQLQPQAADNNYGTTRFRAEMNVKDNNCANDKRGTDSDFEVRFRNSAGTTIATISIINGPEANTTTNWYSGQQTVSKDIVNCQLIETRHSDEFCLNWIRYYVETGDNVWTEVAYHSLGGDSNQFNAVGHERNIATTWFTSNVKTLTFNANGGSPSYTYDAIPYQTISQPSAPSRTGYTFGGWSGVPARMPNANSSYSAAWSVNYYNLTFDANGGTGGIGPTSTAYGAAISAPTVSRTGYTFAGWSPTVPSTMPAAHSTYTAQWNINQYTITWNANGGSGGTTTTVNHGSTPTPPTVTRTGYTFNGWSPTIVAATGNTTYTAQWTANNYNVTFNANGGSGSMSNQSIAYNSSANLTANAFTRTGYSFANWNTQAGGGGTSYANQASYTMNTEGATLYAQWTANTYYVAFNNNGGSGSMSNQTFTYGTAQNLTTNSFSRTGYSFAGWNTQANGSGTAYSNGQSVSNLTSTNGATVTLYAQWSVNSYTITFDANGGTGGWSQSMQYGAALTAPTVTRTGYTFNGWSPSVPGTVPAANTTYTAQWTINQYTITWDANGGTGGTTTTVNHGTTPTPPTVTRTGYTFASWSPTIVAATANTTYTAQWTINSYTITFESAGGTAVSPITQNYGTSVTAPANPTKTGYTFAGWSPSVPSTMPASNTTCTAQWTINSYTITFDSAGGTAVSPITQNYGTSVTAPANPTRTGYTFAGWSPSVPSTMPASNTTCTAQWTINSYTITFNSNGGSAVSPITQNYGTSVTAPSNPTRTGYTFSGWSPSVPSTMPASNTTCTAQWTANTYTISYDGNTSTSGSTANSSHTYDVSSNLTSNGFAKTGFSFLGWSTDSQATTADYTDGQSVMNLTPNPSAVLTFFAVWSVNSYTITFDANGGTGGTSESMQYGSTLTAPTVTRTGYTFTGWDPSVPGTVPATNATYTAQWTINSYTITFDANGGTGGTSTSMEYGATLTAPTVTRTGYTFTGWSPSVPGTVPAGDATYTAQWTINSYTITFDANGGTGGTSTSMQYGATLTAPTVTRTGYTFNGWSPSVPGTVPAGDATYIAQWSINEYTITFDANGGTGGTSTSMEYGATLTAPTVTRTGYTFNGWSPSVPGTVPAGNATYTAQWTINSYTITFDANGGTGGTEQLMNYGATLTPPSVTRTGYTFTGWDPSVPGMVPAGDATYTAQWSLNTYYVSFNANTGSGTMSDQGIAFYTSEILTANAFTKAGYSFAGWNTQADGGGSSYADEATYGPMGASNVTLYAQWSANTYYVSFDANTGSGTMTDQGIVYGADATLNSNTFTKTGYSFAGWNTVANGSGASYANAATFTMSTFGATLYAQWSINQYSIAFNSNGGSAVADIYEDYGTEVPAPSNPTKPGHNFVGWYTDAELTDAVTWPYTLTGDVTFYAKWAVSTVTITFDANGGTGGTSGLMQPGDPLTAPTVTRTGYVFAGWDPTVPATVPGTGTTYTAQWVQTAVTLTKTETGFDVRIYGWTATNQYQIWSYQKVTGDIILNTGSNVPANQWILSNGYTAGNGGAVQQDGSILFSIANFISPDANYTVAVRIADAGGNFVSELRDSYTPADVQEVVINKVLVDDEFSTGREVKEVKPGAAVVLTVECNDLPDIVYTASVSVGGSTVNLTPVGNQFLWSIADLDPAKYTVDIVVTNGVTTATRSIDFQLYSMANIDYAVISNMTVAAPNGAMSITPTYANGSFSYRLGEPGRAPSYSSVETTNTGAINHPNTLAPGVYRVMGITTRLGVMGTIDSFDDGIVRTVTVGRPGVGSGSKTMTLTANPGVEPDVSKGTAIQFTANASIQGASDIQYSFWRYDAKGYVLIKDWSASNTLDWTPARIGIYTIEARAKGSDAGSFEVMRNMVVNVTDNTEQIAQVTNITLNTAELNASAQGRRPVTIKANATSVTGENLLYKFLIEDEFLGIYQIQGYSADQYCVWTPRKAGTYTVHVLVKNEYSFGRYDAMETFEITVS